MSVSSSFQFTLQVGFGIDLFHGLGTMYIAPSPSR